MSSIFMAGLLVEGGLDGVAVTLVSPRGTLLRIFGLPPEPQCFRPLDDERRMDHLLLLFYGRGRLSALLS